MLLEGSFDLVLSIIFLGFSISWIGGFTGLLIGGVVVLRRVFLSELRFWDGLLFMFRFAGFAWDCELLTILGFLGFVSWFGIIFRVCGLLRGFANNDGSLLDPSLLVCFFKGELMEDLSSLFWLELFFLIEGLFMESIVLLEFFFKIRFFILFASSALIELLWLLTRIESFWAASNISLFSRFKSLESS